MFSRLSRNLLLRGICCCTENFLLQDLLSVTEENELGVPISEKLQQIYGEIRKGLELDDRRCDAVRTLQPLLEKVMDIHCTIEELPDFIQLVLEDGKKWQDQVPGIRTLQLHKLEFLKNFITFASSRGVGLDKLLELLNHTRVLAITAAFCSYMLWRHQVMDGVTRSLIYSQYSEKLKVLPVMIMKASRYSCSSENTSEDTWMGDDDYLLEAYIDSLLETPFQLLASSSSFTVSDKKIIDKELRFLKNFLKDQRMEGVDLDEEMACLICDLVSEAGMGFYSLSLDDRKEETELGLSNWMEKVQFLKQDVTKMYSETSRYKFRWTNKLGSTLMAPELSDSIREPPTWKLSDSTQKLSDLIYIMSSYLAWLEDFHGGTYEWDAPDIDRIELRFAHRICSCLDIFFPQVLTSESDDQSHKSFHDCLVVAINKKSWEIYSSIQELRPSPTMKLSSFFVNRRRHIERHVTICTRSFRHVVEILEPFLFGKALDEYMHSAQSKNCTVEKLLDVIQLVLDDGKLCGNLDRTKTLQLHKLEFLKIFIKFATSRGVGQDKLEDLLAHAKVLVTTAAYCSYMLLKPAVIHFTRRSLISSQYSLMLKVQLNDRESYIRALKALGSSCSSEYTKMDYSIVGAFINSLLEIHWELLASKSSFTVSFMKILIEELRFLRNFLIYKADKGGDLDEEMANLICDVVSEAGIISYSLSWDNLREISNRDIKLGLSNWLETVHFLKENIAKKYPETSRYKFPRTNELGFIDGLLEDLKELRMYNPDSIAFAQGQLDVVLEDLVFLRDFVRDMVKQRNEPEEIKALWFRIVDISYRCEFVINSLVVGDPSLDCSPTSFIAMKGEIKKIRGEVEEIYMGTAFQIEASNTPKTSNRLPSRSSNPTMDEVLVGFEDEVEKIIDRLKASSAELDIVSIVGMPGGGKTTLAKKVYNDIKSDFHVCAWCCVSQGYQKRKLLLDILNDIIDVKKIDVEEKSDAKKMKDDEDLEKVLHQTLKGRRYLIVLDDVWDIEAWGGLQSCFPDDHKQSRILLTSRIHIEEIQKKPHFLRPLNDGESRELLWRKLLQNKGCPAKLGNLGTQIAKICRGLPLAVVTVAGILATLEHDRWEEFAESLTTSLVSDTEECTDLLELSYTHLPDHLKPCFLYFGSFLQDEEIPVSRLIWLWMAEGFVQKTTDEKSLENVAEVYLKDLINRSLGMVVNQTSRGGIKTCSVHDLVHQFCVTRAKEENFLQLLNLEEKTGPLSEPRRLCISSWKDVQCFRHLSSLKFFPQSYYMEVSSIFRSFKILKVLDLRGISRGRFPEEVEMLVHLRFLAIAGDFYVVPSTIVKLRNLETFLLVTLERDLIHGTLLPYALFKMTKLRHVHISNVVSLRFIEQKFEECWESCNLETFSTPLLTKDMVKIIRKMPYLRKLECTSDGPFPALDFLSRLESLKVHSSDKVTYPLQFSFSVNLKKLTLSKFALPWASISRFAQLPKLEVLKLLNGACEGEIWDMEDDEVFRKLQFLKFEDLDIVHWNACSDNFPCLQQLVLHKCRELQGIPSGVAEVDSLEMVEVKNCHSFVATSAQNLKEEIEGLKVFIQWENLYVYAYEVNERSDVYSFGVVSDGACDGKRTAEQEFGENMEIVQWVCSRLEREC